MLRGRMTQTFVYIHKLFSFETSENLGPKDKMILTWRYLDSRGPEIVAPIPPKITPGVLRYACVVTFIWDCQSECRTAFLAYDPSEYR